VITITAFPLAFSPLPLRKFSSGKHAVINRHHVIKLEPIKILPGFPPAAHSDQTTAQKYKNRGKILAITVAVPIGYGLGIAENLA
jgi:hypothetical protein